MTRRFAVQLHADQFDRLARPTQPVPAVAELVWNGLDAEADLVEVILHRSEADAVEAVTVRDFGHGMNSQEVDRDFMKVGGSWKRLHPMSKNNVRPMHGRAGEGRFRAFAIGHSVEWETVAEAVTGGLIGLTIRGQMGSGEFEVSEPVAGFERPGTTVRITDPREYVNRLTADLAPTELLVQFTVFLLQYPHVTIKYDGQALDTNFLVSDRIDINLDDCTVDGSAAPVVQVVAWNENGSKIKPSLLLCTAKGNALYEIADQMPSLKDYPYTAYVLWDGFKEHTHILPLADTGHDVLSPVMDAARSAIKGHLDAVATQRRRDVIEYWKAEKVYPQQPKAESASEKRRQDLFDLVAVTAAPAVSKNRTQAKLTLRLLREALEESPTALNHVLREVLDLTKEQIQDFDALLGQTSLGDIIHTTKLVTDRLDFLVHLERLLFEKSNRKRLLERTELHKILEVRGWIFGEEYAVLASDRGLTRVLEQHRHILGHSPSELRSVTSKDGHPLIIDLFLSAVASSLQDKRHLVVELKRPSVKLGFKEVNQIEEYALTVMSEPQFQADGLWWDFWLIGDDMDEKVEKKARQKDRLKGVTSEGDNYRVWVKRWAEVLEENRRRMHFYTDHLNHKSPTDETLTATLAKYVGNAVAVSE